MKRNCPPLYLRRELAVLRPAVLLSFGLETWYAIDTIGELEESIGGENFSRSTVSLDDLTFEMFWLNHPSGRTDKWESSYRLLLDELKSNPLSQAC